MRLYLENSYGKRRHISQVYDLRETNIIIADILEDRGFKSYYTRMWYEADKEELWFDVGSHSEFFVVTGVEEDSNFLKDIRGENNG